MQGNLWRLIAIVAIALILASNLAIAEPVTDEDLLALARKHFNYCSIASKQERDVFDAFFQNVQQGKETNLTPPGQNLAEQDPHDADQWGTNRTIKSEWIFWLCTDPNASAKISPRGIVITAAKIAGQVDLSWAKMQFPLRTSRCAFAGNLILDWASLRSLKLEKAYIEKALSADGLTVDGDVDFSDFDAQKPVSFPNATIAGEFRSQRAHFYTGALSYDGEIKPALDLTSAKIGAGVDLSHATAKGELRLDRAEIKGHLSCETGNFGGAGRTRDGTAISGVSMKVTGNVLFSDRFAAEGSVVISGSTIGGNLDFRNYAKIQRGLKKEQALDAASARIDGSVFLGKYFDADGTLSFFAANIGRDFALGFQESLKGAIVNLGDAKARILKNVKERWPESRKSWPENGKLLLQGFTFNELGDSDGFNAKTQVEWLRLQPGFIAQPYEQMATVFRNMGLEEEGVDVNIAENEHAGRYAICNDFARIHDHLRHRQVSKTLTAIAQTLGDLFWYNALGALIRYGYRPWNALVASLIVVGIGTVLFWRVSVAKL